METDFDLSDQEIIKADVERVQSGTLTLQEKQLLESCLTKYCKDEKISYKQCMNEICAPFILMTRNGISNTLAYQYFRNFIEINMPTMFSDPEFRPLQACFLVFRIVLRYHEPRLSAFFQMNKITPELYTTSWYLTAFGFKIDDLSLLYKLWYELLQEQDQLFLIYISIAFLQYFLHAIINKEDCLVAHAISQLSIANETDLTEILSKARSLKKNMPYSISIRLLQYNIFNLETIDSSIASLEQEYCLVLPPQEILARSFPDSKICDCVHVRCIWCTAHSDSININIIDCRTPKEISAGFLPNTCILPGEIYNKKNLEKVLDYPDQFLENRGKIHLCLMGSTGFRTSSFDIKQGAQNGESDPVQEMIEGLLQAFLIKGFPYISVADGGFEQIHEFMDYFDLKLSSHNKKKCGVCVKGRPSYSSIVMDKMKAMKQTFMGRLSDFGEERKRSRSQDQDKNNTEVTVNSMLRNRKTEGFKCKIFDKATGAVSMDKFVMIFNDCYFAIGNACRHEKFPVSLNYYSKLENLLKITSLREHPAVLNFCFGGCAQVMSYRFKNKEIARKIIDQIKKYYALVRSGQKES